MAKQAGLKSHERGARPGDDGHKGDRAKGSTKGRPSFFRGQAWCSGSSGGQPRYRNNGGQRQLYFAAMSAAGMLRPTLGKRHPEFKGGKGKGKGRKGKGGKGKGRKGKGGKDGKK